MFLLPCLTLWSRGYKDLPEDMADSGQDSLGPGNSEKEKMRRNKKARTGKRPSQVRFLRAASLGKRENSEC
jgi:hypothetical protein